jgi:hypothetical protein
MDPMPEGAAARPAGAHPCDDAWLRREEGGFAEDRAALAARRQSVDAPIYLLAMSVKDEGAFVLEWLAHHKAIGFTDIVMLANDCADDTPALLSRLAELGEITYLPNIGRYGGKTPQMRALRHLRRHPLVGAADWKMFLDIDEFLLVHVGAGRVQDLTGAVGEAHCVMLNWRHFGSAGQMRWDGAPVLETFTRASQQAMPVNRYMKTLVRSDAGEARLDVHQPWWTDAAAARRAIAVNGAGERLPPKYIAVRKTNRLLDVEHSGWSLAQVNHYAVKSFDAFLTKRLRGRGAGRGGDRFDLAYWRQRNRNRYQDRSILAHAPKSREILARQTADVEVRRLHQSCVARYRQFCDRAAQEFCHEINGVRPDEITEELLAATLKIAVDNYRQRPYVPPHFPGLLRGA